MTETTAKEDIQAGGEMKELNRDRTRWEVDIQTETIERENRRFEEKKKTCRQNNQRRIDRTIEDRKER